MPADRKVVPVSVRVLATEKSAMPLSASDAGSGIGTVLLGITANPSLTCNL